MNSTRRSLKRNRRRGFLTIEWIILVTVVVIGTIAAVGLIRNRLIEEYQELTQSICETNLCD
ncbi:MAG TPA: hypothetical protein VMP01_07000 [Pirellulaceae bacterium]|nr:hypothetical protein [Pirellulaceae bacterium]